MQFEKTIIKIDKMRLPVVQPTYTFSEGQSNSKQEVVNYGEMSIKGKRNLKKFSYSSFYPATYDSSYCQFSNLMNPIKFIKKLLIKKELGETVSFTFPKYKINGEPWLIDSLQYKSGDGTKDIFYSIEMSEYRIPDQPYTKYVYSVYNTGIRTSMTAITNPYITKEDDTITEIAQKGGCNAIDLWNANQSTLGPYLSPTVKIPAGLIVMIPGVQ